MRTETRSPGGVPLASEQPSDTKRRLLDAAERLFAERGFEGASMRAITQAAGASVSAANYHFGSKEALLRATLLRRVEPVNRRRFELMEEIERTGQGSTPAVEQILDAFLRPVFEQIAASPEAPARYRGIAARLYSDPPEIVAALKPEIFGPISERFLELLGRALPDRTREELALVLQLNVGLMVHVISGQLETPLGDRPGEAWFPDEALLRRVIAFAAAGVRAASAPELRASAPLPGTAVPLAARPRGESR